MSNRRLLVLRLVALLAGLNVSTCGAAAPPPGKAGSTKAAFTLFNPTPAGLMRDLSTDRPDQTESAYTVDAGHFQLEMDFVNYTHDRDTAEGADLRSQAWVFAPLNLKLGLLNNVDLQFDARPPGASAHRGSRGADHLESLRVWGCHDPAQNKPVGQ